MSQSANFNICDSTHKIRFFCSDCSRLFCGECCTYTHIRKGGFKDHVVEPIEDRLTIEGEKKEQLIKALKQLSQDAEAAVIAKEAVEEETFETLSAFVAQVERSLMSAQHTRDIQCIKRQQRDCVVLLQRDASVRRSVDSEVDAVDALVSNLSLNITLEKEFDKIKKALDNAIAGRQEPNFLEVIYKAAIEQKGQKSLES
jgi:hypothetical protein